jgi:hypothetical protein
MLLSALTPQVPAREREAHLLRTTRLFLAGGDRARADVVIAYARSQLPASRLRSRQWADALNTRPAGDPAPLPPLPAGGRDVAALGADVALRSALAEALLAASRARRAAAAAPPGESGT